MEFSVIHCDFQSPKMECSVTQFDFQSPKIPFLVTHCDFQSPKMEENNQKRIALTNFNVFKVSRREKNIREIQFLIGKFPTSLIFQKVYAFDL